MRRINGLRDKPSTESVGDSPEPRQVFSTGPRMQSAAAFYQLLGERRFGDASQPVDGAQLANVLGLARFREMTARVRDEEIRKAATTPGATVEPERVFRAWAGLLVDDLKRQPNAPSDVDSAFNDALSWGEKVLLELRAERPIVYRNTLQTTTDFIARVGAYEPELLLAREIAKHGALGGSSVLTETLERCFVPPDLQRALGAQVATFPKVASAIPQAPAALTQMRLDDLGVIDAVMLGDTTYTTEVAKLRQSLGLKRSLPGFQLNLRDQVDGPFELRETFGRLAAQLTTNLDATARELIVMLARLQASPEVSSAVKKVALTQIDAHLRGLAKQAAAAGTQSTTFASLAQALAAARANFEGELMKAAATRVDPSAPRLLRDSVDTIVGNVFKVTGDPHFSAEHMATARDPGAILLRRVLDAPAREALVSAALAQSKTPAARAAQIALIGDKAKRDDELAKLVASNKDFRPSPETSALLLSWPADVPRPNTEAAAKAERTTQLASLGPNTLATLIEQGAGEGEIFTELLRLGGQGQFHVGADDSKVDPNLAKIISGDAKPEKSSWLGKDTLTPLMESPAIAALPAQMKAGASEEFVRKSLIRAIRSQNGQLIHEEKGLRALLQHRDPTCRIKLKTVLDALDYIDKTPDPTMPGRTLSTVDPSANILFAYRVLVECSIGLGADADDAIRAAGRKLIKRTEIVCLMPYANLSLDENLALLVKKPPVGVSPDSPQFLALLDRLDLPETVLTTIAGRDDLGQFPAPVLYELFARAVEDKSVPLETVAAFAIAATTLRINGGNEVSATNVWATFNDLATRKYDSKLGSMILAGVSAQANVDVIYRAAASLAAEGRLFDANEVANAVMQRDPATTRVLVNELGAQAPKFFEALSPETRGKLLGRVVLDLASATDASVLDLASSCFARLADLAAAGHGPKPDMAAALEGIVLNAVARIGKDPIETASLETIFLDARRCGVDIEKVVKTVMTDAKAKHAQLLTPAQLVAVRLEVARLVPTSDAAQIKAALPVDKLEAGPYMAAFALIEQRALPDDVLKLLCRSAIGWAADQKAFARVVSVRKQLADAGHNDRLAIFDAALDAAMKDKPDVWSAVPEARALAAISKLEELRPEIMQLAVGGDDAADHARALTNRIVSAGPYAAELVPQVLWALRREVRAMRPSLDDVHVGLEVPESPTPARQDAAPKVPTKDFHGIEIPIYQGDTTHGRVPDPLPFTPTGVGLQNLKKLADAVKSGAQLIVVLGAPGVSKSYTARVLAHEMGAPLVELDGGPGRRVDDSIGSFGRNKHGMVDYARKQELQVYTKGGIIVDDEFRANPTAVLQHRGEQAARFNKPLYLRTNATEAVVRSPQTSVICIGNLTDDDIPRAIMENALVIHFDSPSIEDQMAIAQTYAPTLAPNELELLGTMQAGVEERVKRKNLARSIALSVRNLTRAARRAAAFKRDAELAVARAARESYIDGVLDPAVKAELSEGFKSVFGITPEQTLPDPASIEIKQGPRSVSIGEAAVSHGPHRPVEPAKLKVNARGVEVPYIIGDRERIELEALAKSMQLQENVLYVASPGSGVGGMIEAMAQLTGLDLVVKDMTRPTSKVELFGGQSPVPVDDKTFETKFEPGLINMLHKANKGGIIVLHNVDRLEEGERNELHRMLAERKMPFEDGWVDMHPNMHVIMTTSMDAHKKLGSAFLNRVTQRVLTPKTDAEVLERLTAIGEKLKVPAVIVEDMVRYQTMWTKMCGTVVAKYMNKKNLAVPGMSHLIRWLGNVAEVIAGTSGKPGDLSAQVRETFIEGGATLYSVPESGELDAAGNAKTPDIEVLRRILTAMADGNEDEVLKLNGGIK